ncbi:hypothetical protein FBUS_02411 [Fasciolopsis buskii]|uniref:Uncharacterized protein n=1 Tax=Fasciolopsis buskii TaxID=27845 RepID=A0A8E0VG40_9TREM|nr:hypothetical protein FBUS_02411 [Fasciolopsis buski]
MTLKELLEITQADQPDALKPGEISRVLQVLEEQYETKQLDNLEKLQSLEKKRTQKLEAESGVFLERKSKSRATRPVKLSSQWPNSKSAHNQHHGARNSQTCANSESHPEETKSWIDRQKPGFTCSPEMRYLMDSNQHDSENNTHNSESPGGHDHVNSRPDYANPDACLHLPLWMVRRAKPLMRQFLEAQASLGHSNF